MLQSEKKKNENILLKQENYVEQLKDKIKSLNSDLTKIKKQLIQKEMELSDLEENNLELNNKIVEIKQSNKYSESSKITQLNEQVIKLEKENDILEKKLIY